jgi:hypothetical protein
LVLPCLVELYPNHLIHHRCQLTAYFRLDEVTLPHRRGPAADDG